MIVGAVVFIILIIIQFVVINKGSERVAEVSARFTLDAMPGKQMAIDADLNTGAITETQAKSGVIRFRKKQASSVRWMVLRSMSKGDATAGLIITFVNLIGGTAMGMMRGGLDFSEAIQRYGLLTMGDGLCSQIPSLLISLSTGILVTKASKNADFSNILVKQLFGIPKALYLVGGSLIFLGAVTPLNVVLFAALGAAFIVAGRMVDKNIGIENIEEEVSQAETEAEGDPQAGERCVAASGGPDRAGIRLRYYSACGCEPGRRSLRPRGYDTKTDCTGTWYGCADYPTA